MGDVRKLIEAVERPRCERMQKAAALAAAVPADLAEAVPKDDDGVPLKHNDYITFTFGIPPICVTARITQGQTGWGVECLHPAAVKPKRTTLKDLTKHYQIWKASKARVSAILRALEGGGE